MIINSYFDLINGQIYKITKIDSTDYFAGNAAIFYGKRMMWDAHKFCFFFVELRDQLNAERSKYSNTIGFSFKTGFSVEIVSE